MTCHTMSAEVCTVMAARKPARFRKNAATSETVPLMKKISARMAVGIASNGLSSRSITVGTCAAAKKMAEAAEMYAKSPIAMRLRELQTYVEIAKEKNLIIIMPSELGHVGAAVALAKGLKAE